MRAILYPYESLPATIEGGAAPAPLGWESLSAQPMRRTETVWQYQSDVQPVYVPPPPGSDGSGSTLAGSSEGMFVPRLPAPYRQPAYQPIMAGIDPAALLLADETIPGQGPDATGQNHFSVAYQPRLLSPAWSCYDPIESPLDPDSFIVGNYALAQPGAMNAAPATARPRAPSSDNSFFTTDATDGHGYSSSSSVPIRGIRGFPPPLEQRPLFTSAPVVVFVDSASPVPALPSRRVQSSLQFERGDVSSALAPPPSMPAPMRRLPSLTGAGESLALDLRSTPGHEFAGWWRELDSPTLPPCRIQATADDAGTLGALTPAGFVSPQLALPPRGRPPLNQVKEQVIGEPTPDSPFGDMASPVHQNPFRPKPSGERPAFVDVGREGVGAAMQPLAQPLRPRQGTPIAGETLLYAPPPLAVQVIVGCELYASVPVRPIQPRQQPCAQQPIVAEAVTLATEPMNYTPAQARAVIQGRHDGFHFADVGHTNGVLQPLAAPAPRQEKPRIAPMGTDVFLSVLSVPSVVFGFEGNAQLPAQAPRAPRPLPAQGVIVTEPTPLVSEMESPVQNPGARVQGQQNGWHHADIPASGEPLDNLSLRVFAPFRANQFINESLVYAPAPAPVEVIVGCDLYTSVPMRPRTPATQPAMQQPIVAQAAPMDFSGPAAQVMPPPSPRTTDNGQLAKIDVPDVPASLSAPTFAPRRPPIILAEPPQSPRGFQVLAGLDPMQCGAIAARMRPQAASVLVIDQQNYRVPDVAAFEATWPMPPRSAPRPVWQPIESISTTVFYGAPGNPPKFAGVGQILVTATDLWVFAPTTARIEVSQRGNRLTR